MGVSRVKRILVYGYCLLMLLFSGLMLLVLNERMPPASTMSSGLLAFAALGLLVFMLTLPLLYAGSLLAGLLLPRRVRQQGYRVLSRLHYLAAACFAVLGLFGMIGLLIGLPLTSALLAMAGITLQMWWLLLWMLLQVWVGRQFLLMGVTFSDKPRHFDGVNS